RFKSIPIELLSSVRQIPKDAKSALAIAKQISKELEVDLQLWLIDYLQNYFWEQKQPKSVLQHLDKARELIARYVQPRLVWEVTLLQIAGKI
ncbi:MAG: DNA polymerase III subunit delta', partial [Pseudanabaena sp. ELA748]